MGVKDGIKSHSISFSVSAEELEELIVRVFRLAILRLQWQDLCFILA